MAQSRLKTLRNNKSEVIEIRENEKRVIIGNLEIDYACFRKSLAEKRALRIAKWNENKK